MHPGCQPWASPFLCVSIGWSVPPLGELESLHQFVGPGAAVVVVVVVMDPSVCGSLRPRWSLGLAALMPAAAPRGL